MKLLSQILFWTGIASIPFSWIMWHIGTNIELGLTTMGPGLTPLLSGKAQSPFLKLFQYCLKRISREPFLVVTEDTK